MIKSGAQAPQGIVKGRAARAVANSARGRSWYGGSTSRVVTRGGRIDGYAFQDQACRATTPASRATSPGSGATEDSAEQDGESRSSTAGLMTLAEYSDAQVVNFSGSDL